MIVDNIPIPDIVGYIIKGTNMSSLKMCIKCQGQGKCAPMGGIVKKCDPCDGIGYLSYSLKEDIECEEISVPAKKRGRPKAAK